MAEPQPKVEAGEAGGATACGGAATEGLEAGGAARRRVGGVRGSPEARRLRMRLDAKRFGQKRLSPAEI